MAVLILSGKNERGLHFSKCFLFLVKGDCFWRFLLISVITVHQQNGCTCSAGSVVKSWALCLLNSMPAFCETSLHLFKRVKCWETYINSCKSQHRGKNMLPTGKLWTGNGFIFNETTLILQDLKLHRHFKNVSKSLKNPSFIYAEKIFHNKDINNSDSW